MSEDKFRLLAKCLAAVLIPCLLAATVYYASFINLNSIPKPAVALAFIQGPVTIQRPTDTDIANAAFHSYPLALAVVLKNETEIHINDMNWYVHNTRIIPPNLPEFNGTIEAPVDSISMIEEPNYVIPYGSLLNGSWWGLPPYNLNYRANVPFENTTISTLLVTSTRTYDMGSYTIHYSPEQMDAVSTPGYWTNASHIITNTPNWTISSSELLSKFLEGSGNATIEFHSSFSAHAEYSITYSDNTTQTGEKDLSWNGTQGTIAINYDETGIFELQYHWTRILLALMPAVNTP